MDQIFTQAINMKSLWDNDIHTIQDWRKGLCQLFMYMKLDPFY